MAAIDLERYFERIGYVGPARADLETLRALQCAHVTTIPYENIDARIGRPISLRLPDIEAKLVSGRRGGWCYEHTELFQVVLTALGFEVRPLRGSVRYRFVGIVDPHMLLIVKLEGVDYLAEVGFGGLAPLYPVRFDESEQEQLGLRYRIVPYQDGYLLQCFWEGAFRTVYAFTTGDYPSDAREHDNAEGCELGPSRTLKVHLLAEESRYAIDRGVYRAWTRGHLAEQRSVAGDELIAILTSRFGIELTPEDALRLIEAEAVMKAREAPRGERAVS